jgi:hypothetical protein
VEEACVCADWSRAGPERKDGDRRPVTGVGGDAAEDHVRGSGEPFAAALEVEVTLADLIRILRLDLLVVAGGVAADDVYEDKARAHELGERAGVREVASSAGSSREGSGYTVRPAVVSCCLVKM